MPYHAGNVLAVVSLVFAAGIFTGILSGTKMVDAMANGLVSFIPDALGPHLPVITAIISMPFTFFMSNDAFYFGVLPILTKAAASYGISAAEMGRASLLGQPVHLLSPLVVCTIPLLSFSLSPESVFEHTAANSGMIHFSASSFVWTQALLIAAWLGHRAGKMLKLPAPWLVGGMIGVAALQTGIGVYTGKNIAAWWPHQGMILAQILLGASIGSRLHKNMFIGAKLTFIVGLFSSVSLVCTTILCAFLISKWTSISFVTATLALSPGGIAEMATTSLTLHADAAFVVAVQVLRVILILSFLPGFFQLLNKQVAKRSIRKTG